MKHKWKHTTHIFRFKIFKTNSESLFDYLFTNIYFFNYVIIIHGFVLFVCREILTMPVSLLQDSTVSWIKSYQVTLYILCVTDTIGGVGWGGYTSSSLSRASWSLRWRSRASSQTCCHREQSWLRRGFPPVTCMAGCCCCCCLPEEQNTNISSNSLLLTLTTPTLHKYSKTHCKDIVLCLYMWM